MTWAWLLREKFLLYEVLSDCGDAVTALSTGWVNKCVFSHIETFLAVFASVGWTCNSGLARPVSAHLWTETKRRNGKKGTKGQTVWTSGIPGTRISLDYCQEKYGVKCPPELLQGGTEHPQHFLTAMGLNGASFKWTSKNLTAIVSSGVGLNSAES